METFDSKFYREAVLRICGNLDIESAMSETLKHLKEYMPADVMYLQVYEHQFKAMRAIAEAMVSHHRSTNLLIPIPDKAVKAIADWKPNELQDVRIVNRGKWDIVTETLLKAHGLENGSVMILTLLLRKGGEVISYAKLDPEELKKRMLKGHGVASIVVVSKGGEPFTSKQAEQFSSLREPFGIAVSNALRHRELVRINQGLAEDNIYLQQELEKRQPSQVIGDEGGLKETMDLIKRTAPSSSPVLIMGETGTGKEVLAREIHRRSKCSNGPFIAVNCGAIPEGLLESELFGHEKGAFTGAVSSKKGFFQRADGGTLFLDELGELPPNAQTKLLRAIQGKSIIPVGGSKEITTDFRLICATNRDLESDMQSGKFREDLWYRINVLPIRIKPLRERKEDIPLLFEHFLKKKVMEMNILVKPRLTANSLSQLRAYSWPGNVRELENVVERSLILSTGNELSFGDLAGSRKQIDNQDSPKARQTLEEITRSHILSVLETTGGKIHGTGGAAEILGINPNTLRHRMDRLGIDYRKQER